MNVDECKIVWKGEARPEFEGLLRADLKISGVHNVRNLVTHTCLLTSDYNGPSISCHGDEETGDLIAIYNQRTKWITMDEM